MYVWGVRCMYLGVRCVCVWMFVCVLGLRVVGVTALRDFGIKGL